MMMKKRKKKKKKKKILKKAHRCEISEYIGQKKKSIMCNISIITMPLDFSTPRVEKHLSIVFKLLRKNYFSTLKFNI